jgi:ankyrin repeat protein
MALSIRNFVLNEAQLTISCLHFIFLTALYNDLPRLENFCLKGQQNARDNSNYTALHYAARAGNLQACRILLANGADVNAQTKGGVTSLHRAAMMGHLEICQLLLAHRASLRLTDEDGKTPLHRTQNVEIVKLFLAKDPSLISVRDKHGRTPVDCVEDNHENCTELKALLSENNTI